MSALACSSKNLVIANLFSNAITPRKRRYDLQTPSNVVESNQNCLDVARLDLSMDIIYNERMNDQAQCGYAN
ncbi:hypothetical protein PUN28_009446 [Cardiocondyla obscurior]|uniref:Uncharacterized protein n=1 Tax=Cardiocondyla obscurior TaxID=286306 RepID=A0AAW2FS16_9HYME